MRRLFLVKGSHNVLRMAEINGKAHAITDKGTYRVRDNPHSNSFLLLSPEGRLLGPAAKVLELSEMDTGELYRTLPFSDLTGIKATALDGLLSQAEISSFARRYFLFDSGGAVVKLRYSEMVRIVMYLQTLEKGSEFSLGGVSGEMKAWVSECFSGTSVELGFFVLLECLEGERMDDFVGEWRRKDLFGVDVKGLMSFVEDSFLGKSEKCKVKAYLSKLAKQ